jgi:DNA-binding PucR family transcriptional regulator
LRAFLDAGCNVSAAAAALGVTRQTVASRLRVIEHQIGRPVDACLAELDLALRMHDFEG